MIPVFDPGGNLPPGVHETTWDIFVARFGTNERRRRLLSGLKRALDSLKRAGCIRAYIDGSFVTAKDQPGDFDACWDPVGVNGALLDPVLLNFANGRQLQKIVFYGELFPSHWPAAPAGRRFIEFFQTDKNTGDPKGIVALNVQELP
ncbi:Uncharacterized protein OS=Cyanothece sp. (strain PCC 7822) GN=Cyan7822_0005 PE=4 SV=1 [Gemmata massiliana]|uniref:Uncharacterized protein n=1 Tax=Gemmata massiliana TaxID=1210884 RepID=A0A6P2CYA6_9BACT|nr:hypothetical protein [Gemmata massiliana]VTR93366.1 Uncharacterized protein OS=Cyanothece sp. (strain PCC 7822) GN=Cyan7822_0005 PE=4 SV=1 [Gemmata massiliana]